MSTHTIYEHGNGFPCVGERVYSVEEGTVFIVISIDSHIFTRQFAPNSIRATLAYGCDPAELDEEEFNAIRELHVERMDNECR